MPAAAQSRRRSRPRSPTASSPRIRDPRPAPTPRERERDIRTHLARGLPHHAVARALFRGEATLRTHPRRVDDELGVDNRSYSGALGWSFAPDGHLAVTFGGKAVTP